MRIWIVRTPDGDVYYSGTRERQKYEAMKFAVEVIRSNTGGTWEPEDVATVEQHIKDWRWDAVWKKLFDMGVIREGRLRD